jgi:hypothetical protein
MSTRSFVEGDELSYLGDLFDRLLVAPRHRVLTTDREVGRLTLEGAGGPMVAPLELGGDVLARQIPASRQAALGERQRALRVGDRLAVDPHMDPALLGMRLDVVGRPCGGHYELVETSAFSGTSISRLRILPVGPFGSSSTNHTLRGYL